VYKLRLSIISLLFFTASPVWADSISLSTPCDECSQWQSLWTDIFSTTAIPSPNERWQQTDVTEWKKSPTGSRQALWLQIDLVRETNDSHILVANPRRSFSAWLGNMLIFQSNPDQNTSTIANTGPQWYMFRLPTQTPNQTLTIRMLSNDEYYGLAGGIRIGDPMSHVRWIIRDQLPQLGFGIIYLFLGLIITLFSWNDRLRPTFTPYALFFLILGVYTLSRSNLLNFIHYDPRLWNSVTLISLFIFHPVCIFLAESIYGPRTRFLTRPLMYGSITCATAIFSIAAFTNTTLWDCYPWSAAIALTNISAISLLTFVEISNGNKRVKYLSLGLIAVLITGAIDVLSRLGYINTFPTFQFGTFIFSISVAIYMGYKLKIALNLINNFKILLPQEMFQRFLNEPDLFKSGPEQHELTVMFLDLVGYSLSMESQSPLSSFKATRFQFNAIVKVIHQHGGIVEKTMGDGLLVYFGYQKEDYNHAYQAVQAAISIQKSIAQNMLDDKCNHSIQPARIGINTDTVTIGNIGGDERFEISAMGPGVVIAQRYEQASESFRILIGENTLAASQETLQKLDIRKRQVKIKHWNHLQTALEINPFHDCPDILQQCISHQQKLLKLERKTERITLLPADLVKCTSVYGKGKVINVSSGGIGIALDCYIARGVEITVLLEASDAGLHELLADKHLTEITLSVQWAHTFQDQYIHGCKIIGLNDKLLEVLQTSIVKAIGERKASDQKKAS
jgi:class 3 adenylate cyclase